MNTFGSHYDELTGLLYLEGQLDVASAVELSVHASGCAECRALLGALQRESQLIGRALLEKAEPLPPQLLTAPVQTGRGIAHWAWALSFGLAGTAVYALWVTLIGPWADQLDQLGMGGTNLLASIFFTGAFWEGWDSMLNTLQYAMLAAVGIGALLLLRRHWRRWAALAGILVAFTLLLATPRAANAAEIRRGPSITVAEGETIHNDLIAAGNSLRVDGTVEGDVIAFGQNVTVNGHVTGDVIAFSKTVRIEGTVDGNVRCFCGSLALEGPVGKNASIFAGEAEIGPKSVIGGGAIAFAGNITLDGKVTRDLLFFAGSTALNGTVGGDILLRGGRLIVGPIAQVAGRLRVTSDRRPDIAAGAKLDQPLEFQFRARRTGYRSGRFLIRVVLRYAAAFLVGLLLITVLPGLFSTGMRATRQEGLAMGVGTIVLICGFALAIFSAALMLAGVAAGMAALFLYAPIVYGAQVFVGTWVGEKLQGPATVTGAMLGRLALGLLLLHIAEIIPMLGALVWIAAAIWGTGAFCMALWNRLRPESPAVAA